MNPFTMILAEHYDSGYGLDPQNPAVLVLKILEATYTSGYVAGNVYSYALSALRQYGPSKLIDTMAASWTQKLGQ